METDRGIPIIDGKEDVDRKEDLYKTIAVNALRAMSETLVKMENANATDKQMMRQCVWPILMEAQERYAMIDGEQKVDLDNFILCVRS